MFPLLTSYFHSDDFVFLHSASVGNALGPSDGRFFRPLFSGMLFLEYQLWGLDPVGYHLTNILIHLANAVLLILLGFHLFPRPSSSGQRSPVRSAPLWTGLLFVTLASHSEAVAWLSARADLLATFFALLSLLFHHMYRTRSRYRYLVIALASFLTALFSKESALCFPVILALYEVFLAQDKQGKGLVRRVATTFSSYCLIVFVYLGLRTVFLGELVAGYGRQVHLKLDIAKLAWNFVSYPSRTIVPPMTQKSLPIFIFAVLVVILIATVVYSMRSRLQGSSPRHPVDFAPLYFLVGSYVVSLLPVANLAISKTNTEGERLLYLPSVFFVGALAWFLGLALRSPRTRLLVSATVVVVQAVSLFNANLSWQAAGGVCQSVLRSLHAHQPRDRVCVVNLPDNLRGAYVFRNGFQQAVHLMQEPEQAQLDVSVLALHAISSAEDTVSVSCTEGLCTMLLEPEGSTFKKAFRGDGDCFRIDERSMLSEGKLLFNLSDALRYEAADALFYSAGEFHKVPFDSIPDQSDTNTRN